MIICPWKDILRYAPVVPGLEEAVNLVNSLTTLESAVYPVSNGRVVVMSGTTVSAADGVAEAHKNYLDVQYLVKGEEIVGWAPLELMTEKVPYDPEADVAFYTGPLDIFSNHAGNCYIVYPEDAHMPTRHLENPSEYTKIVLKLKV